MDATPEHFLQASAHSLTTDWPAAWKADAMVPSGHWDELHDEVASVQGAPGALGSVWAQFIAQLDNTETQSLDQQLGSLNRQVRDNGITYNVYADDSGPQRPWSLDLFPLLIPAQAWLHIEQGVTQRMRLLERIMADVYGQQRLVREGLLPAALLQGHPGFLPQLAGVAPVGGNHLNIAAFDMARAPDGHWWIISQRTQAPSGLGYLLENRLIVSRQFQQAFESLPVQRLAAAYQALIDGLKLRSPAGAQANIVLLTPGPYNETYFEHAYLARYLGLTLVQGDDLTVRNDHVYLKTLHGLKPVHGIIKRVDDQWLDPLELRPDSTLGVPGLLQAIRSGHVLVANAPGSGFLESTAMLGFMPSLCEALLGEPLHIPAVSTWWCGEQAVRSSELAQLHEYVIKPTYPPGHGLPYFEPVHGHTLNAEQIAQWQQRIEQHPGAYTLQKHLPLAHMPTWQGSATGGQLAFKPFMLRVFALADGEGSWRVLPGGLARLGAHEDNASMQYGGSSADVWALAPTHDDVNTLSLLSNPPAATLAQTRQRSVTSRSAEHLFWMGRYTERCENTLRLTQLTLKVLHGEDQNRTHLIAWLEALCQRQGMLPVGTPSLAQSRRVFEHTLIGSMRDTQHTTGLGYNLQAVRQAASVLRERLSVEHWNLIGRTEEYFFSQTSASTLSIEQAEHVLRTTSQMLAAITGSQTDRMSRDDGWRLLSIGRHIERLDFLAQTWLHSLDGGILDDAPCVEVLLELFDSSITFHAQYQQNRSLGALADVLLLSQENPRSLAWVVKTLRGRLYKLVEHVSADAPALDQAVGTRPIQETIEQLAADLPAMQDSLLAALFAEGQAPHPTLAALLTQCVASAQTVAETISATYFSHVADARHSVGI
jgi:uncharacterized circularly permuted ATP-grasp superfamily protein/uncharacterized alpha-E superfamily protein